MDLERGIFYRKAIGKRTTKKRQTPAPIPPRLLAHLRHWWNRRLIAECFVEFNGKPVTSVKKGFKTAVGLAGLRGKVTTPHPSPYCCDVAHAARRAHLGGRCVPGHVTRGSAGHLRPPPPRLSARGGHGHRPKRADTFRWLTREGPTIRRKNLMISGRSGRIRTCDPCVPNKRKDQQKQWISLAIDHLYRCSLVMFRWSIGGQLLV